MIEKSESLDSGITIQMGLDKHLMYPVAELYDQAFVGKFKRAVPSRTKRLRLWAELINPNQVIGAFRGQDLLGILLYSSPASSGWLKTGLMKKVLRFLGPLDGIRCLTVFALFEKQSSPNHLYIEAIAVSSMARGLGIGSLLLNTAKVFAIGEELAGLQLGVIFENPRAKALYEREGYETISRESSGVMKSIIGIEGADLMELRLKKDNA